MDINESCAICKKNNDELLMLSCIHDPCIKCAAISYANQVHIKHQNPNIYTCSICRQQTHLDTSTVAQLTVLIKPIVKSPSKSTAFLNDRAVGSYSPRKTTLQPIKQQVKKQVTEKKKTYYCKEHSEEEISYYCYSCSINICPQCAIHGSHKDHHVKLIKKAISEAKGQYMQLISKSDLNQNTMTKYKEEFLKLVKQSNERYEREKNLISRQLQSVKNGIVKKQKEMLKQLEALNKQNRQILTATLQILHQNHEEVLKLKKEIQIILKKDQVQILQDYKKIKEPEERLQSLMKNCQDVVGELSNLNTEFYQQEINEIVAKLNKIKVVKKQEQIWSLTKLRVSKFSHEKPDK